MVSKGVTAAEVRPPLDRAAIVLAALKLLGEVGLDQLSTRRLAAELGVKGPSLYWHFRNMGELRDLMADAILSGVLPVVDDPATVTDWRAWLADGARAIRTAALAHRDGARVLAAARPLERRTQRFPANVGRLQAEGFDETTAAAAFLVLSRYALGSSLGEQTARRPISDGVFEIGLKAMLDGLGAARAGDGEG